MLGWSFISTTLVDLVDTFTQSNELIKQIKLPYTLYLHKITTRNLIIFFHNLLVFIPILVIFHSSVPINASLLLLIPGLMLLYFNAICYGIILSMIGARYRDISQMIKSFIQVIFFLTPVMWTPDVLPLSKRYLALLNPFYSLIEMIRAPLIGKLPTLTNFVIVLGISCIGLIGCHFLFTSRRARIVYWI
jgi:ABC-type polysaccharide/polyol phosphate export permease